MIKARPHPADSMTPAERIYAIENGLPYDRSICTPFIGNMRCLFCGVGPEEYEHSARLLAEGEILAFNHFGYDRLGIGPNTKGIAAALAGELGGGWNRWQVLSDYRSLDSMGVPESEGNPELERYWQAAEMLEEGAGRIVPIELSIGGPFTIAAFLRGIERLLRDVRRYPEEVHWLLRLVTATQKKCIDKIGKYEIGIAMADPVANPALIGPRLYEEFVYGYTKELTDYAYERTGRRVSLHMCGETYGIWRYLRRYKLNEISLDNVVDFERAAADLGEDVVIAGNVDPVRVIMEGTKEEIYADVRRCVDAGKRSGKGFHLSTGCDVPDGVAPEKIEWFMEAAREWRPEKTS